MNLDQYILFFQNEVRQHLPEVDALRVLAVLTGRDPQRVFLEMERLRVAGSLKGEEFEKALTDFYWQFCY